MELVQVYRGQTHHRVNLKGLVRDLPITKVGDGIWIASDAEFVLGDVEFVENVSSELAARISKYGVGCIVTPESKALPLAFSTARKLGHLHYAVCRKSWKGYMGEDYLSVEYASITSGERQSLYLDRRNMDRISGKDVALLDDVVTTTGTIRALEKLTFMAGARIQCKAVIWREGPWYEGDNLLYLGMLPIFVSEEKYRQLKSNFSRQI